MIEVLERVWILAIGYATAGALVAIALHAYGLRRIDPAVRGAGVAFRLLVTPGIVALWPWLVLRWIRAGSGDAHRPWVGPRSARLRSVHRVLVMVLAVAIPISLAVALATRPVAVVSPELPMRPASPVEG